MKRAHLELRLLLFHHRETDEEGITRLKRRTEDLNYLIFEALLQA